MIRAVTIALGALLAGCQSLAPVADVDAVLPDDDVKSRQEIEKVLTEHFGRRVNVSGVAFANNSVLALEHSAGSGPDARLAGGRVLDEPASVRLVRSGKYCVLVDLATGQRIDVGAIGCLPAP